MERLILFIYPTIVVIISALVYRKAITKYQIIALFLTYTGIYVAFAFDLNFESQKDINKGGILIFLCAIAYAMFIFGSGKMLSKIGSLKFTAYAMTIASLAIIVHAFATKGWQFIHFSKEIYYLSILMAILATVIPSFLISEGIRRIGSDNASIISSVGPVSTIILAYIFLNERVNWIQIMGTVLVLAGVLLTSLHEKLEIKKQ
jgi:drug/metabolite transporter (DMT)-like permease